MVTQHSCAAAVAAPVPVYHSVSAPFMWTFSTSIHQRIGTADEGFVYIVSQPNVIITKITGYNEAA